MRPARRSAPALGLRPCAGGARRDQELMQKAQEIAEANAAAATKEAEEKKKRAPSPRAPPPPALL